MQTEQILYYVGAKVQDRIKRDEGIIVNIRKGEGLSSAIFLQAEDV